MRGRRFSIWLVIAAAVLARAPGASASTDSRVLLVLIPQHEPPPYVIQPPPRPGQPSPSQLLFARLAARSELSLGLLNTTQGSYDPQQMVLDISQGTRVSRSTYDPSTAPGLALARNGRHATIAGWPAALARAASAPQTIDPGLLAGSIPTGAGYAGAFGYSHLDAVIAADRRGRVAAVSIGAPASVAARAQALLRDRQLVVADLPPDALGDRELDDLLARRTAGELVIVLQAPPGSSGHQLLPIGMTGPLPARGLSSPTTTLPGLVAAIDVGPTVLAHLGIATPVDMRGQPIRPSGRRDPAGLQAFSKRLGELGTRRAPALEVLLLACFTLLMILGAVEGWERGRRRTLRIGSLAFLWLPLGALLGPIIDPGSAILEIIIIVAACMSLAAVSDRLLPWPRAPLLPAFVVIPVLACDAAFGWHLLVRSILGPNPSSGSRFYGIGNELKSGLTCLLLVGLAAAVGPRPRSRRLAAIVALAGIALGVILGSARLGAGVGGVVIVAAGFSTATVLVLPGRPGKRVIALALASPALALVALALLDLATAGGHGHLTHNVLHANGAASLLDAIKRRTTLAAQGLTRGAMPLLVLAALSAAWFASSNRWLYASVPHPLWRAAFLGGLAAGAVGAFAEDSGPLLFIVAIYSLTAATAYVQGQPPVPAGPAEQWPHPGTAGPPAGPARTA